jgi:hypothetical protein
LAVGLYNTFCILSIYFKIISCKVGQPEGSPSAIPRLAIGHDPEPALATYDHRVDPA